MTFKFRKSDNNFPLNVPVTTAGVAALLLALKKLNFSPIPKPTHPKYSYDK